MLDRPTLVSKQVHTTLFSIEFTRDTGRPPNNPPLRPPPYVGLRANNRRRYCRSCVLLVAHLDLQVP